MRKNKFERIIEPLSDKIDKLDTLTWKFSRETTKYENYLLANYRDEVEREVINNINKDLKSIGITITKPGRGLDKYNYEYIVDIKADTSQAKAMYYEKRYIAIMKSLEKIGIIANPDVYGSESVSFDFQIKDINLVQGIKNEVKNEKRTSR